ncbi:hypothetical protein FRC10_002198 [Ceratobasidium sp. 414]|nr:hypothetical protein FRC10_002198 [Ceratobasidium sp. 414]
MNIEHKIEPQGVRGFPTGNFLIRSHHSQSLYHGRRLLQVGIDDHTQTAGLTVWVDESKGELQEASTMNFESVLQSPQKQSKRCSGRPCQFSYDRVSKVITVSSSLPDNTSDSDSEASLSSPMSERSFPELAQQEFILELIPQKHHCPVARLWNYYVGSEADEGQQQDDEKRATPAPNGRAADGSWHRRRNVRLVAGNDNGDYNPQQATMFQQWDIIPLR